MDTLHLRKPIVGNDETTQWVKAQATRVLSLEATRWIGRAKSHKLFSDLHTHHVRIGKDTFVHQKPTGDLHLLNGVARAKHHSFVLQASFVSDRIAFSVLDKTPWHCGCRMFLKGSQT